MKAFVAFVSLAVLNTSLALSKEEITNKIEQCYSDFPELENSFYADFPGNDPNKCFFKCVFEAMNGYHNGQFDVDALNPYLELFGYIGLAPKLHDVCRIAKAKGKDDCETAYLMAEVLARR